MKITVYTITDCEFSKQEKEYLTSHKLQFEEKNLETNKEFLTEMLAVSNNFAGTPVTKIEKDDGKIEVLKGFTPGEFNAVLGFEEKKEESPAGEKKPAEEMKKPEEKKPVEEVKTEAAVPSVPPAATAEQPPNDQLNSILQDLQAKSVAANPTPSVPSAPEQPSAPTGTLPNVPDFQNKT